MEQPAPTTTTTQPTPPPASPQPPAQQPSQASPPTPPPASTPSSAPTRSGAHSVFDEITEPSVAPTPPQQPTPPAPTAPTPPAPPAEGAPTHAPGSPEAIATAVTEAITRQQQQNTPPPAPTMTAEEAKKAFNVWEPTEDFVTRLYKGGKDALAAMVEMRDGLMKQSVTMSWFNQQQLQAQLQQVLAPMLGDTAAARETAHKNDFYTVNAHLKPYEKLVDQATAALKANGFKAKSKDEAFAKVAETVVDWIKTAGGTVPQPQSSQQPPQPQGQQQQQQSGGQQSPPAAPVVGAQPPPPPTPPARQMPSVSTGAQGGAGGQPATTTVSPAHAVFG